jgi:hypothetical protein
MDKSEKIDLLAGALQKVQAELKSIKMDAHDDFHNNNYTTLGAIINGSRPITDKYGLVISQFPASEGDRVGIENIIIHPASGQWMSQRVYFPIGEEKGMKSAQVAGSAISYIRRYSLAGILGIYSDEDTDGNTGKPAVKAQQAPAPKPEMMSIDNAADILSTTNGKRYGDLETAELAGHLNGLIKKLKENPNDADALKRQAALKMLIASRK